MGSQRILVSVIQLNYEANIGAGNHLKINRLPTSIAVDRRRVFTSIVCVKRKHVLQETLLPTPGISSPLLAISVTQQIETVAECGP